MLSRNLLQLTTLAFALILTGCADEGSINGKGLATAGDAPPVLSQEVKSPRKVLVIGGTRGIGLEVVKLALQRGHKVTATSRHPERLTLLHDNLSNVLGDITNQEQMAELLQNQHVVVTAIGIGPTRDPVSVFSQGMKITLAAIPEGQNPKVISVTGIGAGDSRGHGSFFYDKVFWPLALKTVYEDKDRQELLLKNSDANWTIVRPGFLTDGEAEKRYRIVKKMAGVTSGKISRADVAQFIVAVFEQNLYTRETVLLSN
ncbi:MAG: NAD(P)-dependent oxidoreductase [Halioglobus sp.]